jgi:hypothetical protein
MAFSSAQAGNRKIRARPHRTTQWPITLDAHRFADYPVPVAVLGHFWIASQQAAY